MNSERRRRQRGLTLIELLVFIVVVAFGLAGTLVVFQHTVRFSGDPLVRKQALAIAEALLDEVALHPFTYCDPSDANTLFASSAADCAVAEAMGVTGAEAGQTRYSVASPFNNVNDYSGFSMSPIAPLGNDPAAEVPGLQEFTATVNVTAETADRLRIDVTATRGAETVTLTAYRFRIAPNFGG